MSRWSFVKRLLLTAVAVLTGRTFIATRPFTTDPGEVLSVRDLDIERDYDLVEEVFVEDKRLFYRTYTKKSFPTPRFGG